MQRYKEYVKRMIDGNKEIFDQFQRLHDEYALNPDTHQERYNKEGEKVLEVVREYENRVCANQDRGVYSKYSSDLADKFHQELLRVFPMIDHIGLKTEKPSQTNLSNFNIKKIELPYS